jgi:hypothetical protein
VSPTSTTAESQRVQRGERALELLAVILLGIATIGSAWSAYQSTQWNGDEADLARQASDERVEAARLFGLATQLASYDSSMVAEYAQALAADDERLIEFFRSSMMRPAFLPYLDSWQAELESGVEPRFLLDDPEYRAELLGDYDAAQASAEATMAESAEAQAQADEYVLLTLVFASALFFAGVTSSFRMRLPRILMLVGSTLLIAYAAGRLVELPVIT